MGEAYALNQKLKGLVSEEDLKSLRRKLDEDEGQETNPKRQKQKQVK
ncbi:(6-4)DNA photolyase-like protein [Corchorus olitorius]|uniref:(6-4)DNA photolyase-like protein n=1 Tax=Corchorus olitorius TaxID=93759 RepID=A0A1R3JZ92_9ROSI|nr:(6-4)DNA photolyase-like protein [Corchorus olitorius]